MAFYSAGTIARAGESARAATGRRRTERNGSSARPQCFPQDGADSRLLQQRALLELPALGSRCSAPRARCQRRGAENRAPESQALRRPRRRFGRQGRHQGAKRRSGARRAIHRHAPARPTLQLCVAHPSPAGTYSTFFSDPAQIRGVIIFSGVLAAFFSLGYVAAVCARNLCARLTSFAGTWERPLCCLSSTTSPSGSCASRP